MISNMIRPKNKTEDLLLSITKNCEMLNEQTQIKAGKALDFKMIKPRETFHFNPPNPIKFNLMIDLTDSEVYKFIFDITEDNIKFKLYKLPDEAVVPKQWYFIYKSQR